MVFRFLKKIGDRPHFISVHYEYDAARNVVSLREEFRTTQVEYDALNRPIKLIDATGGVTQYRYDDRSNVIAIQDANQGITRYEYDKNDNLLKVIRPNQEETRYEYDAADNQIGQFSHNGQKVAYQYDALSRLTQVDYYAASAHHTPLKTVRFTYDVVGHLRSYSDGTTAATYTYDALGRQLSKTVNYGPFSLSYAYEYYANGLKKSFTDPSGVKITYSYDDNNRLSAIDIPDVGQVTYNTYQWNSVSKMTFPGGSQIDLAYDPLMRLTSQVVTAPLQNVLMNYKYEYSPVGNITKKVTEQGEYIYEYDKLERLIKAINPVFDDENYTYDALGNRLTASNVAEGGSYDANNALLSYDGAAFEYLNHNLVKKTKGNQVTHYGYNVENQLAQVKEGDSNTLAQYAYDPFGRRLFKEVEGVKTYFLYTDEGLVGEYDENGIEIKGYGYNPDSGWTTDPLFQKASGSYYWYQNDQLGTPQKLTDSSGNVVWEASYQTFGEAQVETALIDNNLRFPGQYFDSETGLHYNYLRDYDPATGRYLQFDPIGLGGGLNGYAYVESNPVNLSDPTGEVAPIVWGGIQYARCIASCAAINVVADKMGGLACGFYEGNCWTSCLNPFNWFRRGPKLGKPRNKSPKPGTCQLNSFPAGTLVLTEEGLKPIEEIKIGEKVLSMDENTETTSYQPVTDLIQSEQPYRLIEITLNSGKSIEATAEHPFYIKGKGWNPASSLKVGQVLVLHNGTTVVVEEVDTRVRTENVYNLTVANTHNYFVGRDGVLVHNVGSGGSPSLKCDPYHPDEVEKRVKPPYKSNSKHTDGRNPKAGAEPDDAQNAYKEALRGNQYTWYARGKNGDIYRYFSDGAGTVHWSGSTGDKKNPLNPNPIPADIKKRLW
jgi:RHS repeat-associated protein